MKMNRELLPIKAHYFLQYAGSSFLVLVLPLILRQKGVSLQGISVLLTVMPIVGLIVSSMSSALADYYRSHRTVFLISIASVTCGLISIYALPDIPNSGLNNGRDLNGVISLTPDADETKTLFGDVTNINGSHFLENVNTHSQEMAITRSFHVFGQKVVLANDDISTLSNDPEGAVDESQILLQEKRLQADENDDITTGYNLYHLVTFPHFWLISTAVMFVNIGNNLCIMIADAVCFQILGSERQKYGHQRLWGTIGMGIMAIALGAIVDEYSQHLPEPDYFPAVVICGVLMTIDFGVVATMHIPYAKGVKAKMADFGGILIRPQVQLFLLAVYVMCTCMGILWFFKLIMIEDVAEAWNPNFPHLKLLLGLDLGIETFGGEMPFFFFSGMIIQRLGYTAVFSISMVSMGVRCCLYYFVSNPWWFLPIELFNGLSFGLFYAVMASYASYVAPDGAQASLQAIVRVGFSIGISTAGFVGGSLYVTLGGGGRMYLAVGLFLSAFCLIYALLSFVFDRFCLHNKIISDRKGSYMAAATSPSTVKEESLTHKVID